MKKQNQRNGTASSVSAGIIGGLIVGLGMILTCSAIMAKMMDIQILPWESVGYWILAMLLLASFSGATTACVMIKRKKLQMSLLSGFVLWATLIGLTAIFFGGQYSGVGVTAGLILAGSICAGLLFMNPKRGGALRKTRYRRS